MTERRLLDVPGAADYLSLAPDTVRELLDRGVLTPARVQLPGAGRQPFRKVLLDRLALDQLVSGWRAVE